MRVVNVGDHHVLMTIIIQIGDQGLPGFAGVAVRSPPVQAPFLGRIVEMSFAVVEEQCVAQPSHQHNVHVTIVIDVSSRRTTAPEGGWNRRDSGVGVFLYVAAQLAVQPVGTAVHKFDAVSRCVGEVATGASLCCAPLIFGRIGLRRDDLGSPRLVFIECSFCGNGIVLAQRVDLPDGGSDVSCG